MVFVCLFGYFCTVFLCGLIAGITCKPLATSRKALSFRLDFDSQTVDTEPRSCSTMDFKPIFTSIMLWLILSCVLLDYAEGFIYTKSKNRRSRKQKQTRKNESIMKTAIFAIPS